MWIPTHEKIKVRQIEELIILRLWIFSNLKLWDNFVMIFFSKGFTFLAPLNLTMKSNQKRWLKMWKNSAKDLFDYKKTFQFYELKCDHKKSPTFSLNSFFNQQKGILKCLSNIILKHLKTNLREDICSYVDIFRGAKPNL